MLASTPASTPASMASTLHRGGQVIQRVHGVKDASTAASTPRRSLDASTSRASKTVLTPPDVGGLWGGHVACRTAWRNHTSERNYIYTTIFSCVGSSPAVPTANLESSRAAPPSPDLAPTSSRSRLIVAAGVVCGLAHIGVAALLSPEDHTTLQHTIRHTQPSNTTPTRLGVSPLGR